MRMGDVIPTRGTEAAEIASLIEPWLGSMVAPRCAARLALMSEREAPVSSWAVCFCPLRRTGMRIGGASAGSTTGWGDDDSAFPAGTVVASLATGLSRVEDVFF